MLYTLNWNDKSGYQYFEYENINALARKYLRGYSFEIFGDYATPEIYRLRETATEYLIVNCTDYEHFERRIIELLQDQHDDINFFTNKEDLISEIADILKTDIELKEQEKLINFISRIVRK